MKKTISINISGVIFHIEEDGYDKLKHYLSSVQQYFSTYEDSQEIVTDIENRIAEKLLAKLKAADKQAVSLEDVNELVAAMGSVADFEAVEEEEVLVTTGGRNSTGGSRQVPPVGATSSGSSTASGTVPPAGDYAGPRRLVRDLRRKTLGGVAAGLAHYFSVDVVWIRLLFVALVVGFPTLAGVSGSDGEFSGTLSGFTVLIYIAMWIALPGSVGIEEDKTKKKFFRNPDDKVLGGVASGIAAYFGVDPGVVRLLFVLGIVFFGVGFLFYIVLWIISPAANTVTEKMEMQGQPITLYNIENSIKQSLNINDTPNSESSMTRILLFPFRAVAMILKGLGNALGPFLNGIVALIRVTAGIILLLLGFALMIACLAFLGAAIGLNTVQTGNFPFEMIRNDITMPMVLSGVVAGLIPAFGLAVLGIMLITTRPFIGSRVALSLAGVWLLALVVFGGTITPVISSFQRRGSVEQTATLNVAGRVVTFAMEDSDADWKPSIELEGYNGTAIQLVKHYRSQGSNRDEAKANALQLRYQYTVQDSTVRFDDGVSLAPGASFRGQNLNITMKIPYGKPFRMTEAFAHFIRNEFGSKEIDRMETSVWVFTKEEGLTCLNFPRELNTTYYNDDSDVTDLTDEVQSAVANELGDDFEAIGDHTRQFTVGEFSKVNVSGAFVVRFRKGDQYKVVADGSEEDLDEVEVDVDGETANVSMKKTGMFDWKNRKRIGLTITVPSIDKLELAGASKANLAGFDRYDNLEISMSGACRTVFDGTVQDLSVDLSGASNLVLRGTATKLDAELSGASKIDAESMQVSTATVDASGASHVSLGNVTNLNSNASGASKVTRQND
ncbi:phage shock protein C (PspC) family protein [Spirosoma oryzae]|uniref:Phage shock protein C (PspC) family protein n=1 Tax=Spirosoma oryzae TaxID=1469603 RepID=A0A2T0T2Z5_9BACT|nr:PspC domain-containing protein [Spirosoma oryzae]PRY40055.1 phage shock protein C (PspC) family protein [Spirosoma oryzae]